jgi:hypothetical protein
VKALESKTKSLTAKGNNLSARNKKLQADGARVANAAKAFRKHSDHVVNGLEEKAQKQADRSAKLQDELKKSQAGLAKLQPAKEIATLTRKLEAAHNRYASVLKRQVEKADDNTPGVYIHNTGGQVIMNMNGRGTQSGSSSSSNNNARRSVLERKKREDQTAARKRATEKRKRELAARRKTNAAKKKKKKKPAPKKINKPKSDKRINI